LFGLIHYRDDSPLGNFGAFKFIVRSLTVQFRNSTVAGFASQVKLGINSFFDSPVRDAPVGLLLNGVYQGHGEHAAYIIESTKTLELTLQNPILKRVRIDMARFSTATGSQSKNDDQAARVSSHFSFWGSLGFDLNLGTLGTLASQAGFTAELLVAWGCKARGASPPVFVGLKLPYSSGNGIGLQGVLQLAIYSRSLLYSDGAYLLKLNGMDLEILGQTLPPGAYFDFYIFGDPAPDASTSSLGWYGAFNKEKKKQKQQDEADQTTPLLPADDGKSAAVETPSVDSDPRSLP